jgi:hypothetical protein
MGKIEEAKQFYCRAIELDSSNEVFYRNFIKILNTPERQQEGLLFL